MRNHLALRALEATALAATLLLANCSMISAFTKPPWPSKEALHSFDVRPLESNRATQISEAAYFADGISLVCGDFPIPPDLRIVDSDLKQLADEVGRASEYAVLAEVERQHPGDPENRRAAETIWWIMLERAAIRGADAAKASGCDAVRPAYLAGWRALRAWRPLAQSGVSPRWDER